MLMDNRGDTNEKAEQTDHNNSVIIPLTDSMSSSIKNEVVDIISNIGEVGIDAALNDGILQEMPFISTAVSIFRIGKTIRERSLLEKMCHFVKEMNAGCVDEAERYKRAEYFKHDKKKRSEELKYIIIMLDRYNSSYRADWLARVYLSYLESRIIWEDVLIYSECIDKILLDDLYYLDFYVRLHRELPVICDENSIPFLKGQYAEKYDNLLGRHYYDSLEVFSPSDRIKMHTDRLVSAGLVELIPMPVDLRLKDVQMYQSTRVGMVFMSILCGDGYFDDPSTFGDYYSNARLKNRCFA